MDPNRLIGDLSRWVAPAVVVTAGCVGATAGLGPSLLVLAGGVLLGVVLLFWSSIGRLTGESPLTLEEAIGLAAPSPEEERKRSILRALKDLEYERSVGKISEQDFAELSGRYRADAKALLKSIDAEAAPLRRRAEERLAVRLKDEKVASGQRKKKKKGAAAAPDGTSEPPPGSTKDDAETKDDASTDDAEQPAETTPPEAVEAMEAMEAMEADVAPTSRCPSCSTSNDADAVFCKRCGVSLAKPVGAES
jgi:hypothetical protein